jgi:hypothetical protein
MNHTFLVKTGTKNSPRTVTMNGMEFSRPIPSETLQLSIDNNDEDAFIDLTKTEVEKIVKGLNKWLKTRD